MEKLISIILILMLFLSTNVLIPAEEIDLNNQEKISIHQITPELTQSYQVTYVRNITDPVISISDYKTNKYPYDETYIIITSDDLIDAVSLSTFISWKESLGYSLILMSVSDSLIQDQNGNEQRLHRSIRS